MTASELVAIIRNWLDTDDATHWGDFEKALDRAIGGEPSERALIVAMLRADSKTIRENASQYGEESPSDARALHEVAATLLFKACQIERGDHFS